MQLNANLIKQLRIERGWTQQQLAEICALSLRTIQRVEVQGIASLETCKALAAAFAVERQLLEAAAAEHPQSTAAQPVRYWWFLLTFVAGLSTGLALFGWWHRS